MKHYIAIDWGEKKIGVAMADAETCIPFTVGTFAGHRTFFDWAEENAGVIGTIQKIIIGIPSHHAQKNNVAAIKQFGKRVEKTFGVAVVFADEMFTSKMAQENLKKAHKKNITADDAEAARILLQEWLDYESI